MSETDRGNALLLEGKVSQAEAVFRNLLSATPDDAQALAGLGNVLIQLGKDDEARVCLEKATLLANNIGHAFSGLAWLAFKRGEIRPARALAERTIAINPVDANALFILAQTLFHEAEFDLGERTFARAAELNPAYHDARMQLGNTAFDRSDFAAAARHFGAYVRARPADGKAWTNYGLSLARAGQLAPARKALEKATALLPEDVKPAALLASVLRESGARASERIPALTRLTRLSPGAYDAHFYLAQTLIDERRLQEAKFHLQKVIDLDPTNFAARWLNFQLPDGVIAIDEQSNARYLSRWRDEIQRFDSAVWDSPNLAAQADASLAGATNFYLAHIAEPLVEERKRNAAVVRKLVKAASPNVAEAALRPIANGRRKLGIFAGVSPNAAATWWAHTLCRLDPASFDVWLFNTGNVDAFSTLFRDRQMHVEVGARSATDWLSAIRTFGPDVMVFLSDGKNPFAEVITSLRHAPVQITTWARPATSGYSTMDYFLSGEAFEADDAASHYSEKLIRLPHLGVFIHAPETGSSSHHATASTRFVCAQSFAKLHPIHDDLFARILSGCTDSRLEIASADAPGGAEALEKRLRAVFEKRQLDFDARCTIRPRRQEADFRNVFREGDVCLDTLDFSDPGATIAALALGLPVITLPGALMRSRITSALLKQLHLDELVATSTDSYVDLAVRVASNAVERAKIAATIESGKARIFERDDAVVALSKFLGGVQNSPVAG